MEWHNRDFFFLLFLLCFAAALSSPFCSHRTFILNVTSAELAFTTETKSNKKKIKQQSNVFTTYKHKNNHCRERPASLWHIWCSTYLRYQWGKYAWNFQVRIFFLSSTKHSIQCEQRAITDFVYRNTSKFPMRTLVAQAHFVPAHESVRSKWNGC